MQTNCDNATNEVGTVSTTHKARASMSEHFKEAWAFGHPGILWSTMEHHAALPLVIGRQVCDILHPGQWSDIVASHQGMHLVQRVA